MKNKNEVFKLFLFLSSSFLFLEESGEELHDGVEELFDLIEILLEEIKVSIAVGEFVDEIFHGFVLLIQKIFFALSCCNLLYTIEFCLSTLFS